jgi:hypothetical protein
MPNRMANVMPPVRYAQFFLTTNSIGIRKNTQTATSFLGKPPLGVRIHPYGQNHLMRSHSARPALHNPSSRAEKNLSICK